MSEVDGRVHVKEVRLLLYSIKMAGIEFNDVVTLLITPIVALIGQWLRLRAVTVAVALADGRSSGGAPPLPASPVAAPRGRSRTAPGS